MVGVEIGNPSPYTQNTRVVYKDQTFKFKPFINCEVTEKQRKNI